MDMRIDLEFQVEILGSNGEVIRSRNVVKSISHEQYPQGDLSDCFVEFGEYDRVKVKLANHGQEVEACLECSGSEEPMALVPGENFVLTGGGNYPDSLVPGYYSIEVIASRKRFSGMYRINPSSMSWSGLMNMREYLEGEVTGLSYDFHARKSGLSHEDMRRNPFIVEVYSQMMSEKETFIRYLDSIVKNPMTDMGKSYREQGYSRKSDAKGERWLARKGVASGSSEPLAYYEKHAELTVSIIENRWIKKIVASTSNVLMRLQLAFEEIAEENEKRIHGMQVHMDEYVKQAEKYDANPFISRDCKDVLRRDMGLLQGEMASLSQRTGQNHDTIMEIKKIRGMLSHYQFETWMKDVDNVQDLKRPSMRMLKDKRYSETYRLHKKLKGIEKKELSIEGRGCLYKKTSKLFEYFTLVLVIRLLKENGFEWVEGWLADDSSNMVQGEIMPETTMVFKKEGRIVEVAYDSEVKDMYNDKSKSRFVPLNARHIRPDIRIALFNEDDHSFIRAGIIEVKCRKQRYLYNKVAPTEVMRQLRDYKTFGYFDAARCKCHWNAIESIIVVYPKQLDVEGPFDDAIYPFKFIQIEPQDEGEIYGYDKLKEQVREIISN